MHHGGGPGQGDHDARQRGAEPEIVDLCRFLVGMGARSTASARPVVIAFTACPTGDLHGTDHRVVADRVEAATYLAAVGLAGGEITVARRPRRAHGDVVLRKLRDMGLTVESAHRRRLAGGTGPTACARPDVATLPVPGCGHRLQALC